MKNKILKLPTLQQLRLVDMHMLHRSVNECERVQVAEVITSSPNLLATTKIRAGKQGRIADGGRFGKGKSHLAFLPPDEMRVQGGCRVPSGMHLVVELANGL